MDVQNMWGNGDWIQSRLSKNEMTCKVEELDLN